MAEAGAPPSEHGQNTFQEEALPPHCNYSETPNGSNGRALPETRLTRGPVRVNIAPPQCPFIPSARFDRLGDVP